MYIEYTYTFLLCMTKHQTKLASAEKQNYNTDELGIYLDV